jgi:hypothetical protein
MWNRKGPRVERNERWKREDAAPRLSAEVPGLQSLSLTLKDVREDHGILGKERIQHIIVERAAALFEIRCAEVKCQDGGYDITSEVMNALRRRRETFDGTSECRGTVGSGSCRCTLVYVARATFADPGLAKP